MKDSSVYAWLVLSRVYVSIYRAALWILFSGVVVIYFRKPLSRLLDALAFRLRVSRIRIGDFELGEPPAGLRELDIGGVVSEGKRAAPTSEEIQNSLKSENEPKQIATEIYLIHAAETIATRASPRTGRYRVRVWLESYRTEALDGIESVTYRLYEDFPDLSSQQGLVTRISSCG